MIISPDRYAQAFASVFAWVFAEANSSKKHDIRPEQMSGAISGHSLISRVLAVIHFFLVVLLEVWTVEEYTQILCHLIAFQLLSLQFLCHQLLRHSIFSSCATFLERCLAPCTLYYPILGGLI